MSSHPSEAMIKTPSTFQPRDLEASVGAASSSTAKPMSSRKTSLISKESLLSSSFPAPLVTNTKKSPVEEIPEMDQKQRSRWHVSHHLLGFILINMFLSAVLLPILAVYFITNNLPDYDQLNQNLIPGYHLTKLQLIGIFIFVCVDLAVYMLIYFTANYSSAFVGCSTELNFKVFNGTRFIPTILIVKLLQPLAIVGSDDSPFDVVIWSIRILICLLLFVSFFPLIMSEVRFLRSIRHAASTTPPLVEALDPLQQYASYLKQFFALNDEKNVEKRKLTHDRRIPAVLFLGLKVATVLFFLLEVAVTNMGSLAPILLDYPLIISAANVVFIYYSHQPVLVKYNLIENKKTVFTREFGCLDGRRCCNKFRPNVLIKYDQMSYSFLQPSTLEYTVYSLTELPKWLKRSIRRRIATFQ